MEFEPTRIPDVVLVKPQVFGDERGFFQETWEARKFAEAGIHAQFVQDNHSRSRAGTLRGLHFQRFRVQGKLVRVTAGEVFDVAVDIRRSSPTFGQWAGAILTAENHHMLWVPPGFAHGFYVLSDDGADFLYKCSDFYAPEYEATLQWDDPAIGIDWPLRPDEAPLLSDKDRAGVPLAELPCFP